MGHRGAASGTIDRPATQRQRDGPPAAPRQARLHPQGAVPGKLEPAASARHRRTRARRNTPTKIPKTNAQPEQPRDPGRPPARHIARAFLGSAGPARTAARRAGAGLGGAVKLPGPLAAPVVGRGKTPGVHKRAHAARDPARSRVPTDGPDHRAAWSRARCAVGSRTKPDEAVDLCTSCQPQSLGTLGAAGSCDGSSSRSARDRAQPSRPVTSTRYGAPPRYPAILSAPRRSRVAAPALLPRSAWVRPTASWASPCHRSRSASGAAFQVASRTSWA
jgi:hypothetical protein